MADIEADTAADTAVNTSVKTAVGTEACTNADAATDINFRLRIAMLSDNAVMKEIAAIACADFIGEDAREIQPNWGIDDINIIAVYDDANGDERAVGWTGWDGISQRAFDDDVFSWQQEWRKWNPPRSIPTVLSFRVSFGAFWY